ncbi:MAG: PrsW family intramembrane metalloprotease [Halanaerobiales bacterium]|nr:PrsW family intramembrane metalloprotease [Halanaerobiales bacterium]
MTLIGLFLVSIVPGIFWVWYFYRQDYLDPEPWGLVFRSFVVGALTVIPVSIITTPFAGAAKRPDNLLGLLFVTIFIIGITEEVFKFLAAYLSVYRNKEFNEVMDGIVYVVTAGLGFAAVENLIYTMAYGYKVGAIRAFVTSLAHAGFSGIVGFNFGMARCHPEKSKFYIFYGLVWASLLHGLYDFFVLSGIFNFYITVGVVLLMQIYLARLIRHAEKISPFNNR